MADMRRKDAGVLISPLSHCGGAADHASGGNCEQPRRSVHGRRIRVRRARRAGGDAGAACAGAIPPAAVTRGALRLTITSHLGPPLRWPINHLAWGWCAHASVFPRGGHRSTGYGAREDAPVMVGDDQVERLGGGGIAGQHPVILNISWRNSLIGIWRKPDPASWRFRATGIAGWGSARGAEEAFRACPSKDR
jgi:hypothetical protein